MSSNLWLPFWINIALLLCAIPVVGKLPSSTRSWALPSSQDDSTNEAGPLLANHDAHPGTYVDAFDSVPKMRQSILQAGREMVNSISCRRNFQILLFSFFLTALASSDTKLLVQYISKRYGWRFDQVCKLPLLLISQRLKPS